MEKINALIDKLQELKSSNADLQSISYYVQLLQAEVSHARTWQKSQAQQSSGNIAVIMPSPAQTITITGPAFAATNVNGHTNSENKIYNNSTAAAVPEKTPAPEPLVPQPVENDALQPAAAVETSAYTPKPAAPAHSAPVVTLVEPLGPATAEAHQQIPAHQPAAYAPSPATATQPSDAPVVKPVEPQRPAAAATFQPTPEPADTRAYQPRPAPQPVSATLFEVEPTAPAKKVKDSSLRKEINELAAQVTPSLNEKLKQSKSEIGERLGDMPVKDLRQAIGINDKFQFIQELFRGDVDMYERSVKTINEFHTLQEAEYWIERELKIRQGWLDDNRAVRHFYSLVKKRFS
jgi:hypothetical protein